MGDRCTVQLTVRPSDLQRIRNFPNLGDVDYEMENLGPSAMLEEANYGHWEELQELAETGVVFFGSHSAGGDYDGCLFVGIGGDFAWLGCNLYGDPYVPILPNGSVEPAALQKARRYFAMQNAAQFFIEQESKVVQQIETLEVGHAS